MIKLENYEVVGWEHALRGMRNPKNSWEKSDSSFKETATTEALENGKPKQIFVQFDALGIGPNDHELMAKLAKAGSDHRKYLRYIDVYVDITAPFYFWKEFKTYRKGRMFMDDGDEILDPEEFEMSIETNSCSTMHKIHEKEFTLEDFSCEHLINSVPEEQFDGEVHDGVSICMDEDGETGCLAVVSSGNFHEGHSYQDVLYVSQKDILDMFVIPVLNANRNAFLKTKDKKYWWQIIQLLPSSYNQKRTVKLNYEVLTRMYHARKSHKLDEWREFCKWIEELPYSEIITGGNDDE